MPKKQFHVYQESASGGYKAVETTGCNSAQEVKSRLPPDVNWYGTFANSAEEAIAKAKARNGGQYKSPEEMKAIESRASNLRAKV